MTEPTLESDVEPDVEPGLVLLLTSPRVPAGLLSRDAWRALETADLVLGHDDEPHVEALRAAGLEVEAASRLLSVEPAGSGPRDSGGDLTVPLTARALVDLAVRGSVVWVGSADGDPGLTDALAVEVSRRTQPPTIEVVVGSHDLPGSRLLDLVAVMDRLRSPGGCPWDAEQTHLTLVPYLVEEAYEAGEAIESGVRDDVVEELGDVLLQVAFHARVGEEHPSDPFDIDDVAAAIVAKMVRRHPHVFADVDPGQGPDSAAVEANWETIKAAEKASKAGDTGDGRTPGTTPPGSPDVPASPAVAAALEGIPVAMPTLARATKVVSRLRRRGHGEVVQALVAGASTDLGHRLLALVAEADATGLDPDQALRAVLRELQGDVAGDVPGDVPSI